MKRNTPPDYRDLSWNDLRTRLVESGASAQDIDRFDEVMSRRQFFGLVGRGSAAVALAGFGAGTFAAVEGLFGRGLIPAAWAQEAQKGVPGKKGLIVHNERPINAETPAHLLDPDITPTEVHFIRNNGGVPERAMKRDPQGWKMVVDGEVDKPLTLTLADLKKMPSVSMPLLIECAGNGRSFFDPPVRGNPWEVGAVGCAQWTGVRLRDVLKQAGVKDSAVYTGHYGEDPPLSGTEVPISRGVPIDKAMEEHTIIAYQMNGKDIDPYSGYPVRLVVPGWVGSCSQKWLTRIWIRDQVHDGPKMGGYSYRNPAYPVVPGVQPPEEDMEIVTAWSIKSIITRPQADSSFKPGSSVQVRGHAWAGDDEVQRVELSTDYGVTWQKTQLRKPPNKYAWYTFESQVKFPNKGYYEVWARAFDDKGQTQPFQQPWNPRGYMANVVHRIPVLVGVSSA